MRGVKSLEDLRTERVGHDGRGASTGYGSLTQPTSVMSQNARVEDDDLDDLDGRSNVVVYVRRVLTPCRCSRSIRRAGPTAPAAHVCRHIHVHVDATGSECE